MEHLKDEDVVYEHCKNCNSFRTCVKFIKEHPGAMIRCICFGSLKREYENG